VATVRGHAAAGPFGHHGQHRGDETGPVKAVIVAEQDLDILALIRAQGRQDLGGGADILVAAQDGHPVRHLGQPAVPAGKTAIGLGHPEQDGIGRPILREKGVERGTEIVKPRGDRAEGNNDPFGHDTRISSKSETHLSQFSGYKPWF
jgi:hypothetical protein